MVESKRNVEKKRKWSGKFKEKKKKKSVFYCIIHIILARYQVLCVL